MLQRILREKKKSIKEIWFKKILDTYPEGSFNLFSKKDSQFKNPVGYTTHTSIEELYDGLTSDLSIKELTKSIQGIVKVRAVQDFSPSEATNFIFLLKQAVLEGLEKELKNKDLYKSLIKFFSRIDEAANLAFDAYMFFREQISEIRIQEVKNQSRRLFKEKMGSSGVIDGS